MATWTLEGVDEAVGRLQRLLRAKNVAGSALRAVGEVIMTDAKRRTPVDTGALRGSGMVTRLDATTVQLAFGGPAAPYAVFVHENLHAHHDHGEAKFLERAVQDYAAHLEVDLASRIAPELER